MENLFELTDDEIINSKGEFRDTIVFALGMICVGGKKPMKLSLKLCEEAGTITKEQKDASLEVVEYIDKNKKRLLKLLNIVKPLIPDDTDPT